MLFNRLIHVCKVSSLEFKQKPKKDIVETRRTRNYILPSNSRPVKGKESNARLPIGGSRFLNR